MVLQSGVVEMKVGIRTPSPKRSFRARTSWKRAARNATGLKAPKGAGWITDPNRAAYSRVYSRTTVSIWPLFVMMLLVAGAVFLGLRLLFG